MLTILNAQPFVFEFDLNDNMKIVKNYYIANEFQEVIKSEKLDDYII